MNISEIARWSEFKWEEILSEIDKSIAVYFEKAPVFIGLPAETQIFQEQMKPFQKGEEYYRILNDMLRESSFDEDIDEDSEESPILYQENWELRNGAQLFRETETLAAEYAALYSLDENLSQYPQALAALACYGLILRDTGYIIETPPGLESLAMALGKRIHANLNKLISILKRCSLDIPQTQEALEKQIHALLHVRESIIELFYQLKTQKN